MKKSEYVFLGIRTQGRRWNNWATYVGPPIPSHKNYLSIIFAHASAHFANQKMIRLFNTF